MTRIKKLTGTRLSSAVAALLALCACTPAITAIDPAQGRPGTTVSLSMKYLVGWPRVEVAGQRMKWTDLKLLGADAERQAVRGEDLIWIEDKILQFRIPDVPPGEYVITVYDDKGPPGQPVHSLLESAAYAMFPPVWPFLFRSNQTQTSLKILPRDAAAGPAE